MADNQILSKKRVDQIIKRIAYQVHENNMDEEVVFVGVAMEGKRLADLLCDTLEKISGNPSACLSILVDKDNPISEDITVQGPLEHLINRPVVLCDDVLKQR